MGVQWSDTLRCSAKYAAGLSLGRLGKNRGRNSNRDGRVIVCLVGSKFPTEEFDLRRMARLTWRLCLILVGQMQHGRQCVFFQPLCKQEM